MFWRKQPQTVTVQNGKVAELVDQPENGKNNLKSFNPLEAVDDADADELTEIYNNKGYTIDVTQCRGYLCHIGASGRVPLPPEILWAQVIAHPDNADIYRHMDKCTYRKLISDDGQGHRHLEVAHEASWHVIALAGSFTTYLDVHEDLNEFKMNYVLLPEKSGGILSKFNGCSRVEADPDDPNGSIFVIEQDISIKVWAPPPLDKVLKSISGRQVTRIFEDILAEAEKINAGKGTLGPYEPVKDKEIGVDENESEA